jgi:hypothetical protein
MEEPWIKFVPECEVEKEFGYVVIEYCTTERPNDLEMHITPQDYISQELLARYREERDTMDGSDFDLHSNDNRLFEGRWKYVELIAVIEQSHVQTYFSESLDHAHYSIHPIEYPSFLRHVQAYQRRNKGVPILKFCSSAINHCIPGKLWVTNVFSNEATNVISKFPLPKIVTVVVEKGKYDEKRGHRKLDTGLASGKCQIRREKWFGISGPNQLHHTDNSVVKEVRGLLYNLLDVALPPHRVGKVYADATRAYFFNFEEDDIDSRGIQIHSYRISMGRKFSSLMIHRDSQNDNEEGFAPVMVISWIVAVKGVMVRIALITYSRKCVSETMKKINRYGEALSHLTQFYQQMEEMGRTKIDSSIFKQDFKARGFGQLLAARIPPHLDTCVHWSAMGADAIMKLNRAYSLTYQQGLALVYSVCACNSPDYFRIITNRLLQDTELGQKYFEKSASFIAIDIYEMIFQFKAEAIRNKQRLYGQRHQPCGNKQASRETICQSLANMIKVCKAQLSFGKNKSAAVKNNVRQAYMTSLSTFCKTENNGGVFGAGPLISNKIIQMGALVGLFPHQFLMQSQIAKSTKTFVYLRDEFKLDDVKKDSPVLLNALSFTTRSNQRITEGLCCKAAQEHVYKRDGKKVKAVDTIYPDMSILVARCNKSGRLASTAIYEITDGGERLIDAADLCWRTGKEKGLEEWKKSIGYWTGTLSMPSTKTPYEPAVRITQSESLDTRKVLCNKEGIKRVSKRLNEERKRKRDLGVPKKELAEWMPFNYPSQSDVLISSLNCRHPINMWALLGKILGKQDGDCASKEDVDLKLVNGAIQLWVPSIQLAVGSIYYPPLPTGSWTRASFGITKDGRLGFQRKDVAMRYAIIRLLGWAFDDALLPFLRKTLAQEQLEFVPQRLNITARRRDPTKMIVFWDNDKRIIEPMAVCLQLKRDQAVFALVDDFGVILKDTSIRFMVV